MANRETQFVLEYELTEGGELRPTQVMVERSYEAGGLREQQALVEETYEAGGLRQQQELIELVHEAGKLRMQQLLIELIYVPRAGLVVGRDSVLDATGLDCTIAGLINQAMLETGIDVKNVTTRGNLGRHIVRHRAQLLARIAALWEGVEVGDIEEPLASPISLVDIGEIVMVEARRTVDQQWFRIPVVPHSEQN